MKKLLKDWFTGIDGETYDVGRAMWVGAGSAPIGLAFVQLVAAAISVFHPVQLALWGAQDWTVWAGGTSGLLVAGAGALALKKGTEPSTTTTRAVVATPGQIAGAATEQSNA